MRIGVIGVGIVGASIGWHLVNHGLDVVMIESGRPGEGVTNWTFSWANAASKTETREYFDLNVAGIAAHVDLAATLGGAIGGTRAGIFGGSRTATERWA